MRPSPRHLFSAGAGLGAFLLILSGVALSQTSALPIPSLPALQTDSCEQRVVSALPAASVEKDSNGRGELEEQLRLLLEELKRLEKDAEEKFRKEILPYLKREIERLRNRLKEFSPDKEETPQPRRIGA